MKTFTKKQFKEKIIEAGKIILMAAGVYLFYLGYTTNENFTSVVNTVTLSKDQIINNQNEKYEKLLEEHKKSQALIKATTTEMKRLNKELHEAKGIKDFNMTFSKKDVKLGLQLVSNYISENESFSEIAYYDSDGVYRNGYGTAAKLIKYKIGDTVKVKNRKGKVEILTATANSRNLPERSISVKEAHKRKEKYITDNIFPHLYGKKFRSQEEFIVATDIIYNRGIGHCKQLFNKDGTINCRSVYDYMTHSKQAYRSAIQKRYAKNYAMCIQASK